MSAQQSDRASGAAIPGWETEPVATWLMTKGRRMTQANQLIDQLCLRFIDVGAPLWRLRVSCQTIHPQISGWAYTWTRGEGRTQEFRAPHGIKETDAYIGSPVEHVHQTGEAVRHRLDRVDPERDHTLLVELAKKGGTDYVALPMLFSDGTTNVLTVATDRPEGFTASDLGAFQHLTNYLIPILEVISTRRIAVALLDTYVGPRTGARILEGLVKRGDSGLIKAALWFSDLRDFTRNTERLPTEQLLEMLNTYFELTAAAVTANGGEVLRFVGDAMLVVFPSGNQYDTRGACRAALDAARDAFSSIATVNHRRARLGVPPIEFGVGLHVGEVIYGNVGAPDRLDFTVIGPPVNRVARLETLTKGLGVSLLMSADFVHHIDEPARSLGFHAMAGVREPQEVFALAERGN